MTSGYNSPTSLPEVSRFQGIGNPHHLDSLQYLPPAVESNVIISPDPPTRFGDREKIGDASTTKSGRICSLRPTTFWLSVALAIVVVIAAAVCGGVAGSRAGQKSSCSSSSAATTTTAAGASTATTTSTGTLVIPNRGVIDLDCPRIDGTTVVRVAEKQGYTFQQACDKDMHGSDSVIVDSIAILAYSLNACLDACAAYSHRIKDRGCIGVEFVANLTAILGEAGFTANCFLKNATNSINTMPPSYRAVLATLVNFN